MTTSGPSEIQTSKAIRRREQLGSETVFPEPLRAVVSEIKDTLPWELFLPGPNLTMDEVFTPVSEYLAAVWVDGIRCPRCSDLLRYMAEFESILFHGLCYRDHLIHQYMVYLSGLPVLAVLADAVSETGNTPRNDLAKTWFMAATYHDIGYPLQLADRWLRVFVKRFLDLDEELVSVPMEPILSKRGYSRALVAISDFVSQKLTSAIGEVRPEPVNRLLEQQFMARNHGVLSSMILWNKYHGSYVLAGSSKRSRGLLDRFVLPAASAIAVHDSSVWSSSVLPVVDFDIQPLAFLLIYCDCLQEWGRPSRYHELTPSALTPLMTNYQITEESVTATLEYDVVRNVRLSSGEETTTFELKANELQAVFSKLRSSSTRFEIVLESKDQRFGGKRVTKEASSGG